MARIRFICQLVVAVVLLALEAAANVSLAFPRPDPLSVVITLVVRRENLSKNGNSYDSQMPVQGGRQHLEGLYEGLQLAVDDPRKPPMTDAYDVNVIVKMQATAIMLLAIASIYLMPKQSLTTSNADAIDDILRYITLIGVIFIGFSISAVGQDSTGRLSANVAFEIGIMMCLSSLALQNLIAAFMSDSLAKLIVLTMISGLFTSLAWKVSFPQYALSPTPHLANLYVRPLPRVQQLEKYGPAQMLPMLAGQSMFFSAGLFTLLFIDFNQASLVGIGSICLLQTIIAGTSILESSAWAYDERAVLIQTSFAFFISIIIISAMVVPRHCGRAVIDHDQTFDENPKGKCVKGATTLRKVSFIDESMRYPIHRVYTYSHDEC